jgi:hypothetical protein
MLNGEQFLNDQLSYFMKNDIDGLVRDHYNDDAVLISYFDIYGDGNVPHIIKGKDNLLKFLKDYLQASGSINVNYVSKIASTDDSIVFQTEFTSNLGNVKGTDCWYIQNSKISRHYATAFISKQGE